jgi:dTMP kinase
MARGKLIVIEGIDGSGKRTQLDLLPRELAARGLTAVCVSFPRYDSFFGKLIGRYLNGEFGSLREVDPHFAALLYAGDRFQARGELESALAAGKTVLCDRYIPSNLAHQTARVAPERRDAFLAWLTHLEYSVYGLPAEDLVIYLRVPATEAHRLIGLKSARDYTSSKRDLHEADPSHLEQAAALYDRLATESNWARIDCIDRVSGELHSPEEIHRAVMQVVETRLILPASQVQAPGAR